MCVGFIYFFLHQICGQQDFFKTQQACNRSEFCFFFFNRNKKGSVCKQPYVRNKFILFWPKSSLPRPFKSAAEGSL